MGGLAVQISDEPFPRPINIVASFYDLKLIQAKTQFMIEEIIEKDSSKEYFLSLNWKVKCSHLDGIEN